ncbi:hypothetical protein VOLCADRAFT_100395 [Volvox carteri f. nagariensis]|uniref:Uncharacterized protein n=1 Tax=Volvox carteri f. nagariensis TaxID=3068 RepID=D8UK39_VOLCA|nr:uncharacterized protein VOLCADRAFT_100395 [Volvox carteri f. nagariensis]EFJ39897.1 hypothetical protein VOLCADRAFT_100395 [Volvox carteri f. nagariensis]|eukprot:XP_002959036.1 hypothetical protein VOLCADRAFT_100395 [Volvox carteri f. nagariensis]
MIISILLMVIPAHGLALFAAAVAATRKQYVALEAVAFHGPLGTDIRYGVRLTSRALQEVKKGKPSTSWLLLATGGGGGESFGALGTLGGLGALGGTGALGGLGAFGELGDLGAFGGLAAGGGGDGDLGVR